MHNIIMSEKN